MDLIVDGYNVVFTAGLVLDDGSPSALNRGRLRLVNKVADSLNENQRAVIVFDAKHPPPGLPSRFRYHQVSVIFAVDHDEADDLIEELIRRCSAPRKLTVVSSDRRLQTAAARRKAASIDVDAWLDQLDSKASRDRQTSNPSAHPAPDEQTHNVDEWLDFFQIDKTDSDAIEAAAERLTNVDEPPAKDSVESEFAESDPIEELTTEEIFPADLLEEIQREIDDEPHRK